MTTIEELDRMGTYLAVLVERYRARARTAEEPLEAKVLLAVAGEIDHDRAAVDKRRLNLRERARPSGPPVENPAEWNTPLVGDDGDDSAHRLAEALGDPVDVATERMLRTPTEQKVYDALEPERNDRIARQVGWDAFHEAAR